MAQKKTVKKSKPTQKAKTAAKPKVKTIIKKNDVKRGRGQPEKINNILEIPLVDFAKLLASFGLTDEEIAPKCGISVATLNNWKKKYPEFLEAIKEAKRKPDELVERSLYQRAVGYYYQAEKIFCGKDGIVTRAPYIAHCPPDVTAQIYWTKNRDPDRWRDRQEHTGKNGGPIEITFSNNFDGV